MKKTEKSNYRVVVWPYTNYLPDGWQYDTCKSIQRDIKRHIDDIDLVEIECDTAEYCEYCGRLWEEDEEGPACCNKAVEEWDAQRRERI